MSYLLLMYEDDISTQSIIFSRNWTVVLVKVNQLFPVKTCVECRKDHAISQFFKSGNNNTSHIGIIQSLKL